MASRKIDDLIPELQAKYIIFRERCMEAGLDFIVTCTYRSQQEQDNLYAIGRTSKGNKVTWTKKSKHTERKAFDIAAMINGKISWDDKDYEPIGAIAEQCGLQWGVTIDGKRRDYPHMQYKEG